MAGIKQNFHREKRCMFYSLKNIEQAEKMRKDLSEEELRKILRTELLQGNKYRTSLRQGDMSRFFQ